MDPRRLVLRALLVTLPVALAGCATGLVARSDGPPSTGSDPAFAFQNKRLAPLEGPHIIAPAALRDGDILLSAEAAPLSSGIRLFTLAPVSHAAVYVGEGEVAEALGGGVRLRTVARMLDEESVIAVFRHPQLDAAAAQRIRDTARSRIGLHYDYVSTFLYIPFALQRHACELPVLPAFLRGACVTVLARVQLGLPGPKDRFFCSSFVLDAYADAGVPLTTARSTWHSPADIMHMREGDVAALPVKQPLVYVGHLKTTPWATDSASPADPISGQAGTDRP